jgi:hypothetical protein
MFKSVAGFKTLEPKNIGNKRAAPLHEVGDGSVWKK